MHDGIVCVLLNVHSTTTPTITTSTATAIGDITDDTPRGGSGGGCDVNALCTATFFSVVDDLIKTYGLGDSVICLNECGGWLSIARMYRFSPHALAKPSCMGSRHDALSRAAVVKELSELSFMHDSDDSVDRFIRRTEAER